jgi:hypothetical protein
MPLNLTTYKNRQIPWKIWSIQITWEETFKTGWYHRFQINHQSQILHHRPEVGHVGIYLMSLERVLLDTQGKQCDYYMKASRKV